MSPRERRPARLSAVPVLAACCAAVSALAGCGGAPAAQTAAPLPSQATVTGAARPSSSAPAPVPARPAAKPSAPASPSAAPKPTPSASGGTAAKPPAAGTASRVTAIPKGAVVVGSGRAASCTGAALQAAVAKVNRRGTGTVSFDCGRAPVTIGLDKPLAFFGEASARYGIDGRGLVTLDGRNRTGIVRTDGREGISYTFRGLTFTRGRTQERGAAIHGGWRVRLLVEDCTFTSNAVTPSSDGEAGGGAIYAHEGSATIRRSTFRDNTARDGGALQSTIADVVVESSTFSGNAAAYAGGAIYADAGVLTVRDSTIKNNTATFQAAGVWMWHPDPRTARIERTTISGNRMKGSGTTGGMGAAILNSAGPLLVTDSTISGNVAYYLGGGLFNDSGATTFRRTRFVGNRAQAGGALFKGGGSITTIACTFSRNTPKDVR